MSGSLSQVPGFVADVLRLGPIIPFQPETIQLGSYSFVPWVRTGLAAQLNDAPGGSLRATVDVTVTVQDETGANQQVTKTLLLRGPGDVLGLGPNQIIRRYPAPGTINAESNILTHIEFDRPELPWLFTPFAPRGDRLPSWMALVVVDANHFTLQPTLPGLPQRFTTRKSELQPLDDAWAWAHAQVSGPVTGGPSVADRLSDDYGVTNLSRILCPRRLQPDHGYVACLVPAYDCGVKVGLGLTGGTLDPAWTHAPGDSEESITLPLYDHWSFRTAQAGDFESLARKLQGEVAPWTVGRWLIDCSKPGGRLGALAAGDPGRVQVFKCALTSPTPAPGDLEAKAWSPMKREELRGRLNEGDRVSGDQPSVTDLPRVSPRIYARFQRAQSRVEAVDDTDWFDQLNTTPVHRIAAGLGTRVVRKDQEQLMQAAWAQVGEIEKVNRQLTLSQFARFAGAALHANHLGPLPLGDLAQVIRGVQAKLRLGGDPLTLAGSVARSAVAPAGLTAAFRRMTRLRGPLSRFLVAAGAGALQGMVAAGDRFQDFRRAYVEPEGITGLSAQAVSRYAPELVGKVFGVQPGVAEATALKQMAVLTARPTVTDQLLSPLTQWHIPAGTIDLKQIGADLVLNKVSAAMPAQPAERVSQAEALGSVLVGLTHANVPKVSENAKTLAETLAPHLGPVLIRPEILAPALAAAPAGAPAAGAPAAHTLAAHIGPSAGLVIARTPAIELAAPAPVSIISRLDTTIARSVGVQFAPALANPMPAVAAAFSDLVLGTGVTALVKTPERPQFVLARNQVLAVLHPQVTVTAYIRGRLGKFPSWLLPDWFDDGWLRPIMAAPVFNRAMYEALDAYDRDWLVPGLGAMPSANLVTLLETNPVFTEAFLVGLSDEMGRELLWRGYPTDQRGTYFKRFWDQEHDELAQPIHQFFRTPLSRHITAQAGGSAGRVVLVVRGELIRRYPNAIMMAMREIGKTKDGHPIFADPHEAGATAPIIFHVPLVPDVILTAFELTVDQVRTQPWWFVLSEHPTAPRFGLEPGPEPPPLHPPSSISRDAVTWASFGPLRLGSFLPTAPFPPSIVVKEPAPSAESTEWSRASLHAAGVARVLLRDPFRAAFSGWKLIGPAHIG
jgi:hypothetical protein